MSDDDMMQALGRIERALSRIEAIEQVGGDRPAPAADASKLAERHDRLRGQVRATLERLDALIAGPHS